MKPLLILFAAAVSCAAQNTSDFLKKGEHVFASSCATGYCHGAAGAASGAPRLASRGFDQTYIGNVVSRGVPGTAMASFTERLSPEDLAAVVIYVASLNGASLNAADIRTGTTVPLSEEAARGARLFREALRGFGRCSTCHEVGGFGIPVAQPIANVPPSVSDFRSLATPSVKTAALNGESMPALVLNDGKQSTVFYDLTLGPPVERNAEAGSVKFTEGSWRHSTVTSSYNDSELTAILEYLRTTVKAKP